MPKSNIFACLKSLLYRFGLLGHVMYWFSRPKKYFGQFGEDIILTKILNLNERKAGRPGFYVDIGAFHPKVASNTFQLYRRGWKGLNIDMVEEKIKLFDTYRSRDINLAAALSDKEGEVEYFHIEGTYGSRDSFEIERVNKAHLSSRRVKTTTLNAVLKKLEKQGLQLKIDFLNIDVESAEFVILKDFDFNKYAPAVIAIEITGDRLTAIENMPVYQLLHAQGYELVGWTQPTCFFKKYGKG